MKTTEREVAVNTRHGTTTSRLCGSGDKSFARIAETNLKTRSASTSFRQSFRLRRFQEHDRVSVEGIAEIARGKTLSFVFQHQDGTESAIPVRHSLSEEQIAWLKAGSALNKAGEDFWGKE